MPLRTVMRASDHMEFLMDKSDAGTGFSRGTTISPVSIIMPMLRTHTPFTTDEI